MIINNIAIENIRRVSELEAAFHQHTLIRGENMAGKTSILYAIQFALLGLSGIKGITADDLFSSGTDSSAVRLSFSVGEDEYKVVRTRKTAVLSKDGEEIATGMAVVTDNIKKLIGVTPASRFYISSRTVAEVLNPQVIEADITQMRGFSILSRIVDAMKSRSKELADKLIDFTTLDALTEAEIKVVEESKQSNEKLLGSYKRDFALAEATIQVASEIQELGSVEFSEEELTLAEERRAALSNLLEKVNTAQKHKNNLIKGYEKETIPTEIISLWDSLEKVKEVKHKRDKLLNILEGLAHVAGEDGSLIYDEYDSKRLAHKAYQEWELKLPVNPLPGLSNGELGVQLALAEELERVTMQLEEAVCGECGRPYDGTNLNYLETRKAELLQKGIAVTPRLIAKVKRFLDKSEHYPEAPEEVDKNELYDLKVLVQDRQKYEELTAMAEGCDKKLHDLEAGIPTVDNADRYDGLRDKNKDQIERHNLAVAELASSSETMPLEHLLEESDKLSKRIADLLVAKSKAERLAKLHLSTDPKWAAKNKDKLAFNIAQLEELLNVYPNPDLERDRLRKSEEVERKRQKMLEEKALLDEAVTETRKIIKQLKMELWGVMLSGASEFVSSITDGAITSLSSDGSGFFYIEDGVRRNVRASSGLQGAVIGLALDITRKTLQADTLPLLLDEVTGVMSTKYRTRFFEKVKSLPYQVIAVTHTEEETQSMETLDVS